MNSKAPTAMISLNLSELSRKNLALLALRRRSRVTHERGKAAPWRGQLTDRPPKGGGLPQAAAGPPAADAASSISGRPISRHQSWRGHGFARDPGTSNGMLKLGGNPQQ
jgi:hypothetical protein